MATTDPYENSYAIDFEDGDYALERQTPDLDNSTTDIIHTVLDGETIFNIASAYYSGDSGRFTDICDYNSIYNPLEDVIPGLKLIIPNGKR